MILQDAPAIIQNAPVILTQPQSLREQPPCAGEQPPCAHFLAKTITFDLRTLCCNAYARRNDSPTPGCNACARRNDSPTPGCNACTRRNDAPTPGYNACTRRNDAPTPDDNARARRNDAPTPDDNAKMEVDGATPATALVLRLRDKSMRLSTDGIGITHGRHDYPRKRVTEPIRPTIGLPGHDDHATRKITQHRGCRSRYVDHEVFPAALRWTSSPLLMDFEGILVNCQTGWSHRDRRRMV